MTLERKKGIYLLIIFLVFSITFSIGLYCYNTKSFEEVSEVVTLSEATDFSIVYADDIMLDDALDIDVVFNDFLLQQLEETAYTAIEKSSSEYLEERVKQKELEEYYNSIRHKIVAEKDGAIFTYDPYIKSNLSVEQYNIILKGTGLEGCGESYYNMEQTYGVNGLFALSVACQESGFGRYLANTNNFYGMRSSKGWMSFESPDANIQYFGKLMTKSLYYGKDILGIGATYCPGTHEHWASCVKSLMARNFNLLLK